MLTLENHVQGRWQAGTGTLATLVNPTTGESIGRTSTGGVDMKATLAYARDVGGPALRALTFAQRGQLLMAVSKAIHAQRDALIELEEVAPRLVRVLECRVFGGMSEEEIGVALGVSWRTVHRDWVKARGWLALKLQPQAI